VSADAARVYFGSIMTCELTETDAASATETRRLAFPDYVRPFAITATRAYLQTSRVHGLNEVDLEAWAITRSLALPALPPGTPVEHDWPFTVDHGAEVSPCGRYLCLLATTGNHMVVLNLPDLTPAATVPLGTEPNYLAFTPEGDRLFITNRVAGGVMVLCVPDWTLLSQAQATGKRPQRICMTRRGWAA
jgi:hypothetical protein